MNHYFSCWQTSELGTVYVDWRCLAPEVDDYFFLTSAFDALKPFAIGAVAFVALLIANIRTAPKDQVMAQTKSAFVAVMVP